MCESDFMAIFNVADSSTPYSEFPLILPDRFCPIITEFRFSGQILMGVFNIKFYENPSCWRRADIMYADIQTDDGWTEKTKVRING